MATEPLTSDWFYHLYLSLPSAIQDKPKGFFWNRSNSQENESNYGPSEETFLSFLQNCGINLKIIE